MVSFNALQPLLDRVRLDVCWLMKPGEHPSSVKSPITEKRLTRHLNGGPYCGASVIHEGESTTRVGLLDLDSHKGETPWSAMVETTEEICGVLRSRGAYPTVFRSTGGSGIHIYTIWDAPQDAYSVRVFLANVLASVGLKSGTKGVAEGEVEVFPKQDFVLEGKLGNMAILPLAGASAYLDPMFDFAAMPKDATVEWVPSAPVPALEKPPRERVAVEASVELAEFREALAAIPNTDDKPLEYDVWRNVIFSIHHATDGSDEGLALAHEFSARSGKYDPDFLDERVWPYIDSGREGGITDRHVLGLAREYGWSDVTAADFDVLEVPEDDFDVLEVPEAPATDLKKNRFAVESVDDFTNAPPPSWHIKGLLPEAELIVLYGPSGSGKSFVALDLAGAIAEGTEWRGRRVKRGRVAYVCAEGAGGFRQRVQAFRQQYGVRLDDLGVIPVAPNFLLKDDVLDVARAIIAWGGADLIILDTWAQVLPGANENSGEDIGKALGHCKGLRRAIGATVMLVHHSGKDESKGARGWSGLKAAADAELEVQRTGEGRGLQVTKMKDGVEGSFFGFALSPITIGIDEDGDAIESCIVTETTTTREDLKKMAAAHKSRDRKGTPALILKALEDNLIDAGGGGLDIDQLIQIAIDKLPEPAAGKRDQRKKTVTHAMGVLEQDKLIVVRGVFVHLPEPDVEMS